MREREHKKSWGEKTGRKNGRGELQSRHGVSTGGAGFARTKSQPIKRFIIWPFCRGNSSFHADARRVISGVGPRADDPELPGKQIFFFVFSILQSIWCRSVLHQERESGHSGTHSKSSEVRVASNLSCAVLPNCESIPVTNGGMPGVPASKISINDPRPLCNMRSPVMQQ